MIIYKCPQVKQSPFSCWLFAPSIAAAETSNTASFDTAKSHFLAVLKKQGYSDADLGQMEENGIGLKQKEAILQAMGLKRLCTIDQLLNYDSPEKFQLYNAIKRLLATNGPLIIMHPAFGHISTHESVLVGVMMAQKSKTQKNEVFLLINDTMRGELTATPFSDFIDIKNSRNNSNDKNAIKADVIFLSVPRAGKTASLYSQKELNELAKNIKEQPLNGFIMNLRKNFLQCDYDILHLPTNSIWPWLSSSVHVVKPLYIGRGQEIQPTMEILSKLKFL